MARTARDQRKKLIAWIEARSLPFDPPPLPEESRPALEAWNLMGGEINWTALDAIAELIGVRDVETLIRHLVVIRDQVNVTLE